MTALDLTCGAELERFCPTEVVRGHSTYTVLTGYETEPGLCFWCGGELRGKLKHYCYGHMTAYYNHFNWGYASYEARKRAGHRCENCGQVEVRSRDGRAKLEVHHIVPLRGEPRFFSAHNLPFNLVVFCHDCHLEIHAIMREASRPAAITSWEEAEKRGQILMALPLAGVGI